jgi:hypothetical protein
VQIPSCEKQPVHTLGSKAEIRECQRHDRYASDSGHIATAKQNDRQKSPPKLNGFVPIE